jgi:hypothetical protein
MAAISRSLAAGIAARHGIVHRHELAADGHSRHRIRRLVEHGALVPIHHDVYRIGTSPDTFEARCAAATAADPAAVICAISAARLWRMHHVWIPDLPHVLVAHSTTPITNGVVLCRTNVLGDEDVVERTDGIRLTSPPRTWFDCARHLTDDQFERLTEWVLDNHCPVAALQRTAERLRAKGRPGTARVRRVMSRRDDWQRPAGSGLEHRVLRALEQRGVRLVRQHPLRLPNGLVIHPDGADPTIRWALEIDHVTWHGGRLDAQRDKARDRGARLIDWQVERVTDQELAEDFDATIDQLVALHRRRRAHLGAA